MSADPIDGATAKRLRDECDVFTRYLLGHAPSTRACAAYLRAHERAVPLRTGDDSARVNSARDNSARDNSARDQALLALARRGPRSARGADSFARCFAPGCLLRKKLICLLAILESSAPTDAELDTADAGTPLLFCLRFGVSALGFALRVVGVALWLPLARLAPGGRA